jgi:Ca2+-binding RTX toxin-like protein
MSGAAGAVTYILQDAADVLVGGSVTGSNAVSLSSDSQSMSGSLVTGLTGLTLSANSNANNTIDLDGVTDVAVVVTADMDADGAGDDILRLDAGSSIEFQNNQTVTTIQLDSATSDLTLTAGDVNGTSSTVGTLNLGTELTTSQATANSATTGNTTGGTVTVTANESNMTVAGVTAWSQNITVNGDENVTLSTAGASTSVKAQSINAGALSGNLTVNVEDTVGNTADVASVTSGSGTDDITMDVGTAVVTVNSGGGNDTVVITDVGATSTFAGSEGDDAFTLTEAATAYVVVGGTGNDTFNTGTNTAMQATIVGGAGTDDTLILGNASLDTTASSANFAISGVEVFELDAVNGTMTMTSTQFATNNAVKLEGAGGNDLFVVEGLATGVTIDASAVTVEATQAVTITYQGGTKNDTITGGDANETLDFGSAAGGKGGSDAYDGGSGTDTFDGTDVVGVTETGSAASQGAVINIGTAAVSGTDVFSQTGTYVSGNLTSVASGNVAYTYAANSTANSANVSTLANLENLIGTSGNDYIVGDAGANTITTAAGLDYVTGGLGADVFVSTATAANAGMMVSDFTSATDDIDYNGAVLNAAVSTIVVNAGTTLNGAATTGTNTAFVINLAANNAGLTTAVTTYLGAKTAANADAVEAAAVTAIGTSANLDAEFLTSEQVIVAVDNLVSGTGESTLFRFINSTAAGHVMNAGELTLIATLGATDLVVGDII